MSVAPKTLVVIWWILRITYGILFIGVGIDKFFCLLTDWSQFMGCATAPMPFDMLLVLKSFGILQICAGILIFTSWIWISIYLMLGMLALIFINLITSDAGLVVLLHDFCMIIHVFVIAKITSILTQNPISYKGESYGSNTCSV